MKYLDYKSAPKNKPIYACSYRFNPDTIHNAVRRKPVKGILKTDPGLCRHRSGMYRTI